MRIGITATRDGLTLLQEKVFLELIVFLGITEFEHGDAIGGDFDCHYAILEEAILDSKNIFKRPCNISNQRAFTKGGIDLEEPIDPIKRNHKIVDDVDILIGCPKGFEEELRSGTWATIRYAKKIKKETYIIYPDGLIIKIISGIEKEFVIPQKEIANEKDTIDGSTIN
jgi:hypothetical protein